MSTVDDVYDSVNTHHLSKLFYVADIAILPYPCSCGLHHECGVNSELIRTGEQKVMNNDCYTEVELGRGDMRICVSSTHDILRAYRR